MGEPCALRARQRQPARLLAGKSRLALLLVGAVPLPLGHQFRSALQPLFGLDHVAQREPIIAAPVLAEFDQVWRTANRAHRPVTLFLAVGVAMHEHRHVAPRECGLVVPDRFDRDTRFRDEDRYTGW